MCGIAEVVVGRGNIEAVQPSFSQQFASVQITVGAKLLERDLQLTLRAPVFERVKENSKLIRCRVVANGG